MAPSQSSAAPPPNDWRGDGIIAAFAVTVTLVLVTLSLRLWVRFRVVKSPGWDDLTIILATCAAIIQLSFNSLFLHYGGGRHAYYLSEEQLIKTNKWSNLAMPAFVFGTALTKISVAFMVIRLSTNKYLRHAMYGLIVSLILVNGACIIVFFAFCRPSRALWEPVPGTCWDPRYLKITSNTQGAWSIVTDLICTATPLVMVWRLQMKLSKKLSVSFLIGFGLATTALCVARVIVYNGDESTDPTWTSVNSIILTTLEDNIGLTAANLPPLGHFSSILSKKLRSSPSVQYLLSRYGGKPASVASDEERKVTIGSDTVRPKRSRDSDLDDSLTGDSLYKVTLDRVEA